MDVVQETVAKVPVAKAAPAPAAHKSEEE